MGFNQEKKLPSGFTVNYWSVQNAAINYSMREASFTILGYKDEEAYRNAPGAAAETRNIRVRREEFDKYFPRDTPDNLATQCYNCAAGKDPLFAESTKV